MSKITVEYLRDLMNEWNRDEISLSRFAELLNEKAKKVDLGSDYFNRAVESIEQSSEPEQQQVTSNYKHFSLLPESKGTIASANTGGKLNPEPPSESEREVIEEAVLKILDESNGHGGGTIPITDFILERDKEKDKQLQDEHRKYTYYRDHCERLEAEIESLKWDLKVSEEMLENKVMENERLKGEIPDILDWFKDRYTDNCAYIYISGNDLYTEYLDNK